ncbi:MAG: hypothetical protein FWE89_02565 [Syntrophaceae bacterium]|nr:hypothetical protein [Syntrophaceae bacterium]
MTVADHPGDIKPWVLKNIEKLRLSADRGYGRGAMSKEEQEQAISAAGA